MPAPVIAYLHMYDAWWSVTAAQWPHVVAAGKRPDGWNLDDVATRVKRRPARVHAYADADGRMRYDSAVPVYQCLDFYPDDWAYADSEIQRRLGVW